MTPDDSGTTSTDARPHGARASCGAAGSTTSACWPRWPRCRASCSFLRTSAAAPTGDGAVRIGEGQTMSQPWIVACMAQLLELDGTETRARGGHGVGLRGRGAVAALRARWSPSSATRASPARRRRRCAELGYGNVEVRRGRRLARRSRSGSVRGHIGDRDGTRRAAGGTASSSWRRARRSSARWNAAGASYLIASATARRRW